MIVWVLWEDQRGEGIKGFGPHTLLLSCLADDLGPRFDYVFLKQRVRASPKKSSSKVLAALRDNLKPLLDDGAVFAVFDRDQVHRLWHEQRVRCRQGLRDRIRSEAKGDYEILFLEENVETLTAASSRALDKVAGGAKPTPEERDSLLNHLAWSTLDRRTRVREQVPSFDRLVRKIGERLAQL